MTILLPAISILLFIIVGEIALRSYYYFRFHISLLGGQPIRSDQSQTLSPIILDEELGWRATENYRFEGNRRSVDGTSYAVWRQQAQLTLCVDLT